MASALSATLMMCSASWATMTNNKVIEGKLVPSSWGLTVLSPTFLSEKQQLQFLERLDLGAIQGHNH